MMGPVLFFRGADARCWHLAALVGNAAGDAVPTLRTATGEDIEPVLLSEPGDYCLRRYDFAFPLRDQPSQHDYAIGDRGWRVHLPARGEALRLAYTACNGIPFTDAGDNSPRRNERWRHLAGRHAAAPFHLLLQGGDQLYADTIWEEVPELHAWQHQLEADRRVAPFTDAMRRHVTAYYHARYVELWSQPDLVPLLASIPSLMMWDDHDIFDGWGSYDTGDQDSPVYQGIYRIARACFALFQLAARADELPPGFGDRRGGHFGYAYRVGDVGIVVPDMRSDRTPTQVMNPANHAWFGRTLDGLADCRQVMVMTSVPLLHADLSFFERFTLVERLLARLRALPQQRDDLMDQWRSVGHRDECARLLRRLLDFAANTGSRVVMLSGEIHLGARGVVQDGAAAIDQLTSSGIVSPPPPALITKLFEVLSRGRLRMGDGISALIQPIPGLKRRYLHARNWLELTASKDGAVAAAWHAEGMERPLQLDLPAHRPPDVARVAA